MASNILAWSNVVDSLYATLAVDCGRHDGLFLRLNSTAYTYETWNNANESQYCFALIPQGDGNQYLLTLPAGADQYHAHNAVVYKQAGGSPSPSTDTIVGVGVVNEFGSFAGITSVANWLRAIGRSDAPDAIALNEINASTNSIAGTFDATQESLQAMRARGDAAWGTIVQPIVVRIGSGEVTEARVFDYQYASFGPHTFTLVDPSGNPVSVAGHAISYVVFDINNNWLWEINNCPVSGGGNNIVTAVDDATNMQVAGQFRYVLRDTSNRNKVLAIGDQIISPAANVQ